MRILYIHNINQVAEIHGNILRSRGHTVNILSPSLVGGGASLPVKLALMPWRMLDIIKLRRLLSPDKYDLVHIHWASYGVIGLGSRVPFIVECHGSDVRHRARHPLFRPLLETVFRRAAAVVGITPDLMTPVHQIRPDALFLPGPVDTERFAPSKTNQRDPSHPWTILLFTRLDPVKGPEIATEGIARFAGRHPDVLVQILDWGLLRGEYKQRYGDRFEFVQPVPPEEVQNMIWSADVVVGQFALGILSFCELQAMSCAKPVICSSRYDDAYPTPPPLLRADTPEKIDSQLEKLYQQPGEAACIGRQAREWIMLNYDSHMLTSKLERLYEHCLQKKTHKEVIV